MGPNLISQQGHFLPALLISYQPVQLGERVSLLKTPFPEFLPDPAANSRLIDLPDSMLEKPSIEGFHGPFR